jgi:hypothetical protein
MIEIYQGASASEFLTALTKPCNVAFGADDSARSEAQSSKQKVEDVVKQFIEIVRNSSSTPSKEILLLTDNLGIHRQPESICKALNRDCYQIYFPPNCSHFIQPLDNLLFANLKRQVYRISAGILNESLLWDEKTPSLQEIVIDAVQESFPSVFSVRNIVKSWDNVGVHPLQPQKIRQRCEKNVGKISNNFDKN